MPRLSISLLGTFQVLLDDQPAGRRGEDLSRCAGQSAGYPVLYRLWPGWSVGRLASRRAMLLAAARGQERLMAVCYFANDTRLTLYAVFRSLNLAEAAGLSPELARGYASVGMIIGLIPLHKVAEAYFRRALEASQAVEDLSVQIWVSLVTGVYFGGVGCWARAGELLQQSIGLAEQMRDRDR